MYITAQIQKRLSELGMSKRALSHRSGIPISTLHRVLKDPGRMRLWQLMTIAKHIGLTVVDDLFIWE